MNIIVTGGSRGIGEAIVRKLADDGHNIDYTYLHSPMANKGPKSITGHRVDVNDVQSSQAFF